MEPAAAPPKLLERSAELSLLEKQLDFVRGQSSGRLGVVGGEAGVGKTTLVRTFCGQAQGSRVLWGACDSLFTPRPLGPFVDIASATGGELARLATSRARPYEVAAALIDELRRGTSPTLVVLEDMQWADEATLDAVRLLTRRIEGAPGLVLLTYRDDELAPTHPLRFLLGELPRQESVFRIRVQRLSAGAVAALAAPAGVDADELYRKTAGNPFFVRRSWRPPARRCHRPSAMRCWRVRHACRRMPARCSMPSRSPRRRRTSGCWRRSPATRCTRWANAWRPGCSPAGTGRSHSITSWPGSRSSNRSPRTGRLAFTAGL